MFNVTMIAIYLGAIVAANLTVTHVGMKALPYTAFLLIPFDLVTRDVLHGRWHASGVRLWLYMGLLIAAGSMLSAALNRASIDVARASFLAFTAAGLVNAGFYELLWTRSRWLRMNVSNFWSACADSVAFPLLAFGYIDPTVFSHQTVAKFVGGAMWTALFLKTLGRRIL